MGPRDARHARPRYGRVVRPSTGDRTLRRRAVKQVAHPPSEYWARKCYVGASFFRRVEVPLRYEIGVDQIMWGGLPAHGVHVPVHAGGAAQHVRGVSAEEMQPMVGLTAAERLRLRPRGLAPIAERVGPTVAELAEPLAAVPAARAAPTSTRPYRGCSRKDA